MFKKIFYLASFIVTAVVSLEIVEHDPNYPKENQLIDIKLWKYNFNTGRQKRAYETNQQFLQETKLCDSKISFKRPQKMKDINNKWRTIINHDNYTQFLRFEECSSLNFPCTYNIYPQSVRSFCQQKYSKISLWSLNDDTNCLVMDKFIVPSTCNCMIEKDDFFKGVSKDLLGRP